MKHDSWFVYLWETWLGTNLVCLHLKKMTKNLLIVGNIAVETNFPQCLVKISLKTMFNEPLGANPIPACQLPLWE